MARFTQYIGLSPVAQKFLSRNKHKVIGEWHMTEGIVGEPVMGKIYEVWRKGMYHPDTCVEIVQEEIWSAGPMIFTCLMFLPSGQILRQYRWRDEEMSKVASLVGHHERD